MIKIDTIAAIATPLGRGGIGILRISGPLTASVTKIILGKILKPRQVEYLPFLDSDGSSIDHGIALFFSGPNSFTGEDILELQCHGGPVILDMLLNRILAIDGVRIARPGEFSERAFLNDKIDLSQAEAIEDLINASSAQAARSAVKSLQGVFSDRINKLIESLTNLRIYIESDIDFPDENIDILSDSNIKIILTKIISNLSAIQDEAYQGSLFKEGITVVIAGKPNAGKSSLFNALVEENMAIVTNIAGTTRDVLREHIHLEGIPIHIIDTAGLREFDDKNEIEKIGINRAWNEIEKADHVLLVTDGSVSPLIDSSTLLPDFINRIKSNVPITQVRNKADLTGENIEITKFNNHSLITISAKLGKGINLIKKHLKHSIGFTGMSEAGFLARRRHLDSLKTASLHLINGKKLLESSYKIELLAEELKLAQKSLSEITGKLSSNELIDKIFSSFCIGK